MFVPIANVIDVDEGERGKDRCGDVLSTCAALTQCPYGVERWVDSEGCDNCRCYNPCVSQDPQCPANMTCAIMPVTNPQSGLTEYRAICRECTYQPEWIISRFSDFRFSCGVKSIILNLITTYFLLNVVY